MLTTITDILYRNFPTRNKALYSQRLFSKNIVNRKKPEKIRGEKYNKRKHRNRQSGNKTNRLDLLRASLRNYRAINCGTMRLCLSKQSAE